MDRVISVGVLLLAAGLGQLASISPTKTSDQNQYTWAMSAWGKSENLSISPKAQNAIALSFEQHNPPIADFGGNLVWKDTDRTLKQTLVIYYLGNLRDFKTGNESRNYPTPMEMNQGERKDRVVTSEMKAFGIDLPDVEAYPVEKFLVSIQPVLKGPKGELHVVSKPTGAAITLDSTTRGYTEKITVESAGDHHIVVGNGKSSMRCEGKVNVPAGRSVTFQCP